MTAKRRLPQLVPGKSERHKWKKAVYFKAITVSSTAPLTERNFAETILREKRTIRVTQKHELMEFQNQRRTPALKTQEQLTLQRPQVPAQLGGSL
jgi:hypothetical protein